MTNNINYKTKKGMIILNDLIRFLLTTDPELRDSDLKLFRRVYEVYRVDICNTSFDEMLNRIARKEIPSFESIRRARQKIQEQNDELKSSVDIQNNKNQIENEFYDFDLSV